MFVGYKYTGFGQLLAGKLKKIVSTSSTILIDSLPSFPYVVGNIDEQKRVIAMHSRVHICLHITIEDKELVVKQ